MLERLTSYTSEIKPSRSYRNFFIWAANLPLREETIEEGFAMTQSARIVDMVGCANITNLIAITEQFSSLTDGEVRVFDAARETNVLLPFYFQQIGVKEVFSKDGMSWYIQKHTELPVVGHESYITYAPMVISLIPSWYEDVVYKKKGNADVVFVDKTLMWASNPIGLLKALAWSRGTKEERKIVISIYKQFPIIIHSLQHGSRIAGIRKNDKVSFPNDAYPGMLATLSDILRDGREPLWQISQPGRLYAYPKRINGRTHWLPDFDPAIVDMSLTVYARQFGTFRIEDKVEQLIYQGKREFWNDGSDILCAESSGEQDRKFLIGAFDIVDVVLLPDDIDTEKAKRMLARKHYTRDV